MKELFFNTINTTKQSEIRELFAPFDCDVKFLDFNITEILSHDIREVILAKSLAAVSYTHLDVYKRQAGHFMEGNGTFVGSIGIYWSATHANASNIYGFRFYNGTVYSGSSIERALYAVPVRCVVEE